MSDFYVLDRLLLKPVKVSSKNDTVFPPKTRVIYQDKSGEKKLLEQSCDMKHHATKPEHLSVNLLETKKISLINIRKKQQIYIKYLKHSLPQNFKKQFLFAQECIISEHKSIFTFLLKRDFNLVNLLNHLDNK